MTHIKGAWMMMTHRISLAAITLPPTDNWMDGGEGLANIAIH